MPSIERPTRVGLQQRGEDADRGGLARAVRAEHTEDGGPLDGQVDAAQGLGRPEPLHQALGLHRGHRFARV